MSPSEQTKRELVRRRFETVRTAQEGLKQYQQWLDTGQYQRIAHTKEVVEHGKKVRRDCTDDELKLEMEQAVASFKDVIERWSAPFEWELKKEQEPALPKALARAMAKLRKRTRRMLRQQGK